MTFVAVKPMYYKAMFIVDFFNVQDFFKQITLLDGSPTIFVLLLNSNAVKSNSLQFYI